MHGFFSAMLGIGIVLCVVAAVYAFVRSGEPKDEFVLWDSANLGGRWRGLLKIGGAMIALGLIGLLAVALAS